MAVGARAPPRPLTLRTGLGSLLPADRYQRSVFERAAFATRRLFVGVATDSCEDRCRSSAQPHDDSERRRQDQPSDANARRRDAVIQLMITPHRCGGGRAAIRRSTTCTSSSPWPSTTPWPQPASQPIGDSVTDAETRLHRLNILRYGRISLPHSDTVPVARPSCQQCLDR